MERRRLDWGLETDRCLHDPSMLVYLHGDLAVAAESTRVLVLVGDRTTEEGIARSEIREDWEKKRFGVRF